MLPLVATCASSGKSLTSSFFPFISRVRTPPYWPHPPSPWWYPSPCLSNPVARPRCAGVAKEDAATRFQPPDTLCSTAACCTKKQLSVAIERLLGVTVSVVYTTPLRPCCAPSGQDLVCTAPSPPGGSRECRLYSDTTHTVRRYYNYDNYKQALKLINWTWRISTIVIKFLNLQSISVSAHLLADM